MQRQVNIASIAIPSIVVASIVVASIVVASIVVVGPSERLRETIDNFRTPDKSNCEFMFTIVYPHNSRSRIIVA